MKILIISVFFPPENTIASLRIHSWAKYWGKNAEGLGHDVTVLTTIKEKSATNLKLDMHGFELQEVSLPKFLENFIFPTKAANNNVDSNNCRNNLQHTATSELHKVDPSLRWDDILNSPVKLNVSLLRRIIVFIGVLVRIPFKFILNQFRKYGAFSTLRMPDKFDLWYFPAYNFAKKDKWDLVISSYGPYVSHIIAQKLKKTGQARKWIADYRDLWTMNQAFSEGVFPFNLYEEYLEEQINKNADIITTVSEPLASHLRDKYQCNNIYTIENGFDFDDLNVLDKAAYWNDDKIRMVYTGSIYEGKQNPEPLFQAIAEISRSSQSLILDKFELLICGRVQPNIVRLVKKYNIEKWVSFSGFLPREDILRMQQDAHALLYLEFNHHEGILTGKIFEYLASQTLILSVGGSNTNSYVSNFIRESNCGKILGDKVHVIKDEILLLLNTPRKIITDNSFAHKYSRKILAQKMLSLIN